jgi:hypothetical protein
LTQKSSSRLAFLVAALLVCIPESSSAQLLGKRTHAGCISVTGKAAQVTAQGRLELKSFPGPPNYESVAAGDVEERVFILRLPHSVCIDDGDFANPENKFRIVHISSTQDPLMKMLRSSVGRRVIVSGEGFAAFDGHHHAPLVILADRIAVR